MPVTPNRDADACVPAEKAARAPAPIDDTWKDEFVDSLLRELRRQLQQIQNSQPTPDSDQANIRSQNVQALARIERSLDRLIRVQEQRALKRDIKVAAQNDDARAALERRLDQLLDAARANLPPGEHTS